MKLQTKSTASKHKNPSFFSNKFVVAFLIIAIKILICFSFGEMDIVRYTYVGNYLNLGLNPYLNHTDYPIMFYNKYPPFMFELLAGWFALFGNSVFSLRALLFIFELCSTFYMFKIGKLLWDNDEGLVFALLYAFLPMTHLSFMIGENDSIPLFFMIGGLYYFLLSIKNSKSISKYRFISAALFGLGISFKIFPLFLWLILLMVSYFLKKKKILENKIALIINYNYKEENKDKDKSKEENKDKDKNIDKNNSEDIYHHPPNTNNLDFRQYHKFPEDTNLDPQKIYHSYYKINIRTFISNVLLDKNTLVFLITTILVIFLTALYFLIISPVDLINSLLIHTYRRNTGISFTQLVPFLFNKISFNINPPLINVAIHLELSFNFILQLGIFLILFYVLIRVLNKWAIYSGLGRFINATLSDQNQNEEHSHPNIHEKKTINPDKTDLHQTPNSENTMGHQTAYEQEDDLKELEDLLDWTALFSSNWAIIFFLFLLIIMWRGNIDNWAWMTPFLIISLFHKSSIIYNPKKSLKIFFILYFFYLVLLEILFLNNYHNFPFNIFMSYSQMTFNGNNAEYYYMNKLYYVVSPAQIIYYLAPFLAVFNILVYTSYEDTKVMYFKIFTNKIEDTTITKNSNQTRDFGKFNFLKNVIFIVCFISFFDLFIYSLDMYGFFSSIELIQFIYLIIRIITILWLILKYISSTRLIK
ncbi:MAG: ArnT family glycosyltransferase [Promethearchaeota archaeon]